MQQLVEIDLGTLFFFQSVHHPWLDPVMIAITRLGDQPVLFALLGLTFLLCLYFRAWRTGLLLVVVFGLAWLLTQVTKDAVARSRPDVAYALVPRPKSGSFPSGHATLALTFYGILAIALGRRFTSRWATILLALGTVVVVMLVGVSRLYLGVHFLTDVVGGWIAGGAFVLLFLWADRPTPKRTEGTTTNQPDWNAFVPREERPAHSASQSNAVSSPNPKPVMKPGWWRKPSG